MRTDGRFGIKHVLLKGWKPGETLHLVPFGDVHHDSPGFSGEAWGKFLKRARELTRTGKVLFLGMGDYFDGYSGSERAVIMDGRLHESSVHRHEQDARNRVKALAKDLDFMHGHLIGLLGGNHFFPFGDGSSSDNLLANLLGCDYLGACAAMRVTFDHCGRRISLDIFAHHGKGGGTTAGGRLNAVEKLDKVCQADLFLMGDNHARGCIPTGERLCLVDTPSGLSVKAKPSWIGRTGSFLRAYIPGQSSYVCDAALPPSNLGHIEFTITLVREQRRRPASDLLHLEIGAIQ